MKGGPVSKSPKLIDQMKRYGFNYAKELAFALKAAHSDDPLKRFGLLQDLLPYMVPKLREREVDTTEEDNGENKKEQSKISDADLLKALGSDEPREAKPVDTSPVGARPADVQVQDEAGAEKDLHDVDEEQGEE